MLPQTIDPEGASSHDAPDALHYRDTMTDDEGDAEALPRRLLRAVETYKASCLAAGEQPAEDESWLILLAALRHADDK